ncbi:MAG: DUF4868 domain-containing protein [Gammaproteobacteria bacterium]|nr:DUF4868 domain-containing protein [Gammaproteobacteria bacterium]
MSIEFNISSVKTTEFGVGRKARVDADIDFRVVPVDKDVKSALTLMVEATIEKLDESGSGPVLYEPAEKHGSTECLFVPRGKFDTKIRELHDAENLAFTSLDQSIPEAIDFYFARFIDDENRRLTAIKRAVQFKGLLKKKVLHFVDDTLQIVKDDVFKLDNDFDLILDSMRTLIFRPTAFEVLCGLNDAVMDAVTDNVHAIASDLPFIDLSGIENYAKSHPRAARYLASIRSQSIQGMDQNALAKLCESTDVNITDVSGKIVVKSGSEMGFLEVLDRRRYRLELVPHQPEQFRASSRERINRV